MFQIAHLLPTVEASVPGHCVSGTMPKASKAAAASRSRSSRLNSAMAVAEVSLDRNLFASPGSEAELAINPVAWVEFVVRDVSFKLGSAMRQFDERQIEDVPVLWRSQVSTQQTTLAGQQWPVVSTVETSAGTSKSCKCRRVTDEYRLLLSFLITDDASTSSPPGLGRTLLPEVNCFRYVDTFTEFYFLSNKSPNLSEVR